MQDSFGREINYLRISVIDRCNLRCFYCMPQEGMPLKSHAAIISFEEIIALVKIAVTELGFNKVRLTGGEPLLRRDVVKLVAMLAKIDGIEDLAMTTNGVLLAHYAAELAHAGLQRVNVSLDTLDAVRFAAITRGGDINAVLAGVAAARQVGLAPIKINCVVESSSAEPDAMMVKQYAAEQGVAVRFIRRMDFARGVFSKIEGGQAGDCSTCCRLRLLSDGRILPCLFTDKTFAARELGARAALVQAIKQKPERGGACLAKWMGGVGG